MSDTNSLFLGLRPTQHMAEEYDPFRWLIEYNVGDVWTITQKIKKMIVVFNKRIYEAYKKAQNQYVYGFNCLRDIQWWGHTSHQVHSSIHESKISVDVLATLLDFDFIYLIYVLKFIKGCPYEQLKVLAIVHAAIIVYPMHVTSEKYWPNGRINIQDTIII